MGASIELDEMVGGAFISIGLNQLPLLNDIKEIGIKMGFRLAYVIQLDDIKEYEVKKTVEKILLKYSSMTQGVFGLPIININDNKYLINFDLYGSIDELSTAEIELFFSHYLKEEKEIPEIEQIITSITTYLYYENFSMLYDIINAYVVIEEINKCLQTMLSNYGYQKYVSIYFEKSEYKKIMQEIINFTDENNIFTTINDSSEEKIGIDIRNINLLQLKELLDFIKTFYSLLA